MLDRVICAVYDVAKDGQFMAQHQMAEWLGSNIVDLYAVLEAIGHKKIKDPADDIAAAEADVKAEDKVASATTTEKSEGETAKADKIENDVKIEKPELATFALKKGKAMTGGAPQQKKNNKFANSDFKSDKKKLKSSKEHNAKPPRERVYKAEVESKPEDSPFAVLQQLKTNQKD